MDRPVPTIKGTPGRASTAPGTLLDPWPVGDAKPINIDELIVWERDVPDASSL